MRRTVNDMDGVDDVLEADRYADALPGADLVVLALALTPETEGIIAADELALMERHAWLVNVARGGHVVTDDLVDGAARRRHRRRRARRHRPRAAARTATRCGRCRTASSRRTSATRPEMAAPLLAERIATNVRRFGDDEELIGLVDVEAGY